MTDPLLPGYFRSALQRAALIKEPMLRVREIDRLTRQAQLIHPEKFKPGVQHGPHDRRE